MLVVLFSISGTIAAIQVQLCYGMILIQCTCVKWQRQSQLISPGVFLFFKILIMHKKWCKEQQSEKKKKKKKNYVASQLCPVVVTTLFISFSGHLQIAMCTKQAHTSKFMCANHHMHEIIVLLLFLLFEGIFLHVLSQLRLIYRGSLLL